jgi:hypothetical protein
MHKMFCCGEEEDPETKKKREIAEMRTTIWCLTGPRAVPETIEERQARGRKLKQLIIDLSMLTGEPPEFPAGADGLPAALGPVAGKTPKTTPPQVSTIHSLSVSTLVVFTLSKSSVISQVDWRSCLLHILGLEQHIPLSHPASSQDVLQRLYRRGTSTREGDGSREASKEEEGQRSREEPRYVML